MKYWWILVILAALFSAFELMGGLLGAKSAPQQAAVAAMAAAQIIIPYCLVRAITELGKESPSKKKESAS
jgi:hypothetical protein